ncbi:MAG: branched-chain amino acid ABC transporter permease [Lautropia sp.]
MSGPNRPAPPPPDRADAGRRRAGAIGLAVLGVVLLGLPAFLEAIDSAFYVSTASRIGVFAIAATSLNLVLGYGGLVSFGHAAFVGLGAYTVTLLSNAGFANGWLNLAAAMACAALASAAIGAISLRTRGVYFIMITLAFAQMLFYLANSIKAWGGDEGLNLERRLDFFGIDFQDDTHFYFLVLAVFALTMLVAHRLAHSRFGRVVAAMREDDVRAESIGFPTWRYKLILFVIGGAFGGLAGALMANQQNYVSPNLLHWSQSGTMMVMIIIGGVGTLWGGALGALTLLVLEEIAADFTTYWQFYVGWILLAVVLFAPRGLSGIRWRRAATFNGNGDGTGP